jgi:DNA repair photolyase
MQALTSIGGFLRGSAYSLNPYTGCAFGACGGCPFCSVRALPVAHARAGRWGECVIKKTNLPQLLEREPAVLACSGRLVDAKTFMSNATDPYQGAWRRQGLTRRAREAFARHPPRRLMIQTRSPLIERDLDVTGLLGHVRLLRSSSMTDDDSVRRATTPTSPAVARRLMTMRRLRAVGIFITDTSRC